MDTNIICLRYNLSLTRGDTVRIHHLPESLIPGNFIIESEVVICSFYSALICSVGLRGWTQFKTEIRK